MKKRALSLLLVLSLLAALIGCGTKRPGRAKQAPEGPQSRSESSASAAVDESKYPGSPTREKEAVELGL